MMVYSRSYDKDIHVYRKQFYIYKLYLVESILNLQKIKFMSCKKFAVRHAAKLTKCACVVYHTTSVSNTNKAVCLFFRLGWTFM